MLHTRPHCQVTYSVVAKPMYRTLTKISPATSLMEETADRIRDAIISGELTLGSKLSEQRLADMLGVSRSPVREAFAALQSEGLVNVFAKRGSFVFTPDLKEVDDLCEHRSILEAASLRSAMASNRSQLLTYMNAANAVMEQAAANNDPSGFTKGDFDFHNVIITSGGNHSIASSYRRTISRLMALRTHLFVSMNEKLDRSMDEHRRLIAAVTDGHETRAADLIEEHVFHLSEAYRAALDSTAE
jgi:DNA-binding GntR family transcriptional regulator